MFRRTPTSAPYIYSKQALSDSKKHVPAPRSAPVPQLTLRTEPTSRSTPQIRVQVHDLLTSPYTVGGADLRPIQAVAR